MEESSARGVMVGRAKAGQVDAGEAEGRAPQIECNTHCAALARVARRAQRIRRCLNVRAREPMV